jgi:REP element-mobilizing transposase RayT
MPFKPYNDPTHLYFITATILGWRPLFSHLEYARIILDSLDWHRKNGRWGLYAYVLMPNHLHAIVKPLDDKSISSVLQSFGSFTAHTLLDRLACDGYNDLLAFFAERQDHDVTKQHQIWQPIQAKNVSSVEFLREKLEYIHNNPIAKKWHLAEDRADYAYSSACFYDRGVAPLVGVDDVRDWLM